MTTLSATANDHNVKLRTPAEVAAALRALADDIDAADHCGSCRPSIELRLHFADREAVRSWGAVMRDPEQYSLNDGSPVVKDDRGDVRITMFVREDAFGVSKESVIRERVEVIREENAGDVIGRPVRQR